MNTPIVDFVKAFAETQVSRLHMPGHKGAGQMGVEQFDITEVDGADVLYCPHGIILQSENNATALFKTVHTFYSVEGSSLCIKAMLAVALNGKKPLILAARNVHKAFLYGAALLDVKVEWLYPEDAQHICACRVTPESLKTKLKSMTELPSAVYVTSPDYLGNVQDIKGLAAVCHEYGIPLLADNAHGAYMGFLKESQHPIHLGADMCCDSAHKTLPVLTGGAYLHIGQNAPKQYSQNARRFLSVFASTSPSYLILQSLDLCNAYIADGFKERLSKACQRVARLKSDLEAVGWSFLGGEPMKLTVNCSLAGHDGQSVAEALRKNGVECEFSDRDVVVLMFTCENDEIAFSRVEATLRQLKAGNIAAEQYPTLTFAQAKMSIREALFSEQETVAIDSAVGRVCAAPNVSCPPAVPPVISGEVITRDAVKALKYYGVDKIDVVK